MRHVVQLLHFMSWLPAPAQTSLTSHAPGGPRTATPLQKSRSWERITPTFQRMQLLPVKHCIHFKGLLFVYKSLCGWAPPYLSNLLHPS